MSAVKHTDILFRTGGVTTLRYGRPFIGHRRDASEPEAYTFTRADASTCATYVDADGKIRTAAANKLRLSYVDTALAGTWDACGLLLESSRTNLCLQSENFGTTWTTIGTPTRVAGNTSCGVVSLDLIGDDDAASAEGYRQTGIVITGTVAAFSVMVDNAGSASKNRMQVVDTTAVATRLDFEIAWAASVPTVTATVGTHLQTQRLASGKYRFLLQCAAITSGNTHRIDIYPAYDSAGTNSLTGTLNCGAVQLEAAAFPSSYIKTTTASVTRAADSLTFPIGFPPQDLTMYAKFIRPAYADASGSLGALVLPTLGEIASLVGVSSASASRTFTLSISDNAHAAQTVSTAIPAGATISYAVQVGSWATGVTGRMDVGSGFGSYTTPQTAAVTAWPSGVGNLIYPCSAFGAATPCCSPMIDFIVARGTFTLAEMAACPTP